MKIELTLDEETKEVLERLVEAINNLVDAGGCLSEFLIGKGWKITGEEDGV